MKHHCIMGIFTPLQSNTNHVTYLLEQAFKQLTTKPLVFNNSYIYVTFGSRFWNRLQPSLDLSEDKPLWGMLDGYFWWEFKATYWRMAPMVNPGGNEVGKSFRECTTISTLVVNTKKGKQNCYLVVLCHEAYLQYHLYFNVKKYLYPKTLICMLHFKYQVLKPYLAS